MTKKMSFRAGNFLRTIEEEWSTLMFFCEVDGNRGRGKDYEKLAIFGTVRSRRGAELKVLSAVETKVPGYFEKIKNEVIERDKGKGEERRQKRKRRCSMAFGSLFHLFLICF